MWIYSESGGSAWKFTACAVMPTGCSGYVGIKPPGQLLVQLQLFQQHLQRLGAMTELRLLVVRQFGAHLAQVRQPEHRVIAETAVAALLMRDLAAPFAFGNDGLRVI